MKVIMDISGRCDCCDYADSWFNCPVCLKETRNSINSTEWWYDIEKYPEFYCTQCRTEFKYISHEWNDELEWEIQKL